MKLEEQIELSGPKYRVYIERGKIREFARAMGAELPEFVTFSEPVIPPMFLICAPYTWGYSLERPRGTVLETINHDLTVSLHAQEKFKFHGSMPKAGDELLAQTSLENVVRKQGKSGGDLTFLTMLTEYKSPAEELLVEQRSISVTTEKTPGEDAWLPEIPTYDPHYEALETPSPFAGIQRLRSSRLETGLELASIKAQPLTKQQIVRFQGVVGEDDPFHHDPEWAAKNGYPSVFALGSHLASNLASLACHLFPPQAFTQFDVRFSAMGWPGDILQYVCEISHIDRQNNTVTLQMKCHRQSGEVLVHAEAVLNTEKIDEFTL